MKLSKIVFGAVALLGVCRALAAESVTYRAPVLDENGALTGFETAECTDYTAVVATDEPLRLDGGWYVVDGANVVTGGVEVVGDVKLILKDGSSLMACPTNSVGCAGVHIGGDGRLTLYAQSSDESTMGELIAFGGEGAAGIGGNAEEPGHDITINGGKVTALGGIGGAGIGGGEGGDGYNLVISGGRIRALSLTTGAGIGGGGGGCGHEILVRGGTVSFSKAAPASHLGSGYGGLASYGIYIGGGSVLTIMDKVGSVVRDRLLNAVYPVALQGLEDGPATVTDLAGYGTNELTVVDGELMLWLMAGTHTFTVNGASKTVTVTGQGEAAHDPVTYRVPTIVGGRVSGFTEETCTIYGIIDAFTAKRQLAGGWYVASGEFASDQPLEFLGDAHLILRDGAKLKAAGVKAAPNCSLTIYAQSADSQLMGALTSVGGDGTPGLGGTTGSVTINGGNVNATGGKGSAGIGGATVAVNGGIVRAKGGSGASADIGGGVTILDGTVLASTIGEPGKVTSICGGSVCGNPVGNVGTFCVTLVGGWTDGAKVEVSGVGNYSTHQVYAMERSVYLWLANGTYVITAGYLTADVTVAGAPVSKTGTISYLDPVFDAGGATTNFVTRYRTDYNYYENAELGGKYLAGGWHVISGECTINKDKSLYINGDVKLILENSASLTKPPKGNKHHGLIVQTGSLTVYAQTTDKDTMGKIDITGGEYCAAIGSGDPEDGCANAPITINGGNITATGGDWSAGIGSSKKADASKITINGGIVTASGGKHGAGIGGGEGKDNVKGNAVEITINGGEVMAVGGEGAAGIGGGQNGAGHSIFIRGGKVMAIGGEKGAGIGGGEKDAGYDIIISGGKVYATSPKYGAGIGGGDKGDGFNITISGGFVDAKCEDYGGSGIGGGGNDGGGSGHHITISGGLVVAQGDENGDSIGSAKGCKTTPHDIVFTGGSILPYNNDFGGGWPTDGKGNKVYRVTVSNVQGACTVTGLGEYGLNDIHTYSGELYLWLPNGTHVFYVDGLKYRVEVSNAAVQAYAMAEGGTPYLAYDAASDTFSNAVAPDCRLVGTADTVWGDDGKTTWYLANGEVTIDHTVNVRGNVNLILGDNCELKVNGGLADSDERRGAAIRQTGSSGSFTVYAQTEDRVTMGVLIANGADFGAGIGGGDPVGSYKLKEYDPYEECWYTVRTFESGRDEHGRNITINGGAVSATGGKGAAGIGGAQDYSGENITINGGSVMARGGRRGGAGIGGGGSDTSKNEYTYGDARNIRITGGLVTAVGGDTDFAENEGRSSIDCWFSTVYEVWGHGTDIGGGGSYTREEGRNNTPESSAACCIPVVGYFITAELLIYDMVMQYTDEYTGGGECDYVYISGGTVEAVLIGGENEHTFQITGGSLRGAMFGTPPKNAAEQQVYMVNLRMTEKQVATLKVPGYGVRDILPSQDCGYVCLWLPAGYQEITYDGVNYAVVVNDSGDFSQSVLGNDLNVTVDGVKVTEGDFMTGCKYSSSDNSLRIKQSREKPYVISGAENNGRFKLVVESNAELVFSNLVLTAKESSDTLVTFGPNTKSRVELKGQANFFACNNCAIAVDPLATVTFFGDGPLTAVAGTGAAAIGSASGRLCGGITIEGGRFRVCGGKDAAAIGTGNNAGPTSGTFANAGPITISGGWISSLDTLAHCDIGCGKYESDDHSGNYVNVPVTIAGGTLDLSTIRGTTRSTAPSQVPTAEFWWWVTNANVVIDGGVYRGEVAHGGSNFGCALNGRGELVWSNRKNPCYTGTAAAEVVTDLVAGSQGYGMNDARAIDGYLYLWLPTNTTLGVSHSGGVTAMTGLTVNGRDLAWGDGDGWNYDPVASLLTLDDYLYYRLHEGEHGRTRDLRIAAVTNVTVTLDGVCLSPTHGAPIEVAADRSLSIEVLVSNSLVAADSPAIELKAGSSVFVESYDDPSAPEAPLLEIVGGANSPGIGTLANADTGIHIGGATVLATGGGGAAGLGGGAGARTPTVKIVGGHVIADRIGRGSDGCAGGAIVVEGGSVEAEVLGATVGADDPAPISIIGGSVAAKEWWPQPVEASGLIFVHDTLIGYPWSGPADLGGLGDYGTTDLYPAADGYLHLWLPASYDTTTVTVDQVDESLVLVTSQVGGRACVSVDPANLRTDYTKDEAELVAANALVIRPNAEVEAVVGPLAYSGYFDVTARPSDGGSDGYTLEVTLSEATRKQVQESFAAALPNLIATVTNKAPTVSVATLPGLYYGLAGASEIGEVKGAAVPAWTLGTGDREQSIKGVRPAVGKSFYLLKAKRESTLGEGT